MSTLKVAAINNPSAGSGGLAISTSGNVTGGGLDLITSQSFTAVSSVSMNNCFTSTYEHYKVTFTIVAGTLDANFDFRFRASGADNSTSDYFFSADGKDATATPRTSSGNGSTSGRVAINVANTRNVSGSFDVHSPLSSGYKSLQGQSSYEFSSVGTHVLTNFFVGNRTATAYDGFSLYPTAGTFTGTLRVYGYRN